MLQFTYGLRSSYYNLTFSDFFLREHARDGSFCTYAWCERYILPPELFLRLNIIEE